MMMEWLKLCILYVRASRKWKLGIPVGWFWVGMRRIETTVSPPNECDKQKHNDHKHTAHTQTDRQEEMFIYIGQKQSQRRSYTQNTHSIIIWRCFVCNAQCTKQTNRVVNTCMLHEQIPNCMVNIDQTNRVRCAPNSLLLDHPLQVFLFFLCFCGWIQQCIESGRDGGRQFAAVALGK